MHRTDPLYGTTDCVSFSCLESYKAAVKSSFYSCVRLRIKTERTYCLSKALKCKPVVSIMKCSGRFYVNVAYLYGLLVLLQRYFFRLLAFLPLHMLVKWSMLLARRGSCKGCFSFIQVQKYILYMTRLL